MIGSIITIIWIIIPLFITKDRIVWEKVDCLDVYWVPIHWEVIYQKDWFVVVNWEYPIETESTWECEWCSEWVYRVIITQIWTWYWEQLAQRIECTRTEPIWKYEDWIDQRERMIWE